MEFKSLSATALESAIECPARFEVTHIDHAADEGNDAADVGTAVHGALEMYVRTAVVDKSETQSPQFLAWCYRTVYPTVFGSLDLSSETFLDGITMLNTWYERADFTGFEVLLLETKEEFSVPVAPGVERPFRYVFDRLDQLDDTVYRVVDYKTIRARLTHEQLRRKLQARAYGLAAQIRHKDATRVEVEFDLLRHQRIGVVFSKQENADTWRLIKSKAQELWAMSEPDERLNLNCRYCVRAPTCKTLQSNIDGGGINSLSMSELVDLKYKVESQQKGLSQLADDVDERLLNEMQFSETTTIQGETAVAEAAVSYRRSVTDPSAVAAIVGPEIASRYGRFNLGDIDKIMTEEPLTPEQRAQIQKYIQKLPGDPKIKTRRA